MAPFGKLVNIMDKKEAGLRYGQLIAPNVCQNFGPMYIAKSVRHT